MSGVSRTLSRCAARKLLARRISKTSSVPSQSGVVSSAAWKRWLNALVLSKNVSRIRRSVGAKPKSGVSATLSEARSIAPGRAKSSGRRTFLPWIVVASGSEPASETMVESSRQRSGRLRAIGPSTGSGDQPSWRFSLGTRPGVGRKPTMPLKAAGLRREPPVSEPVASGTMLVASTTPRTAGGAGRALRGVERVAGRAIDGVAGIGARAPFRRVGLAGDDRAGLAHAGDDQLVLLRHEIAIERAAIGGAQASGVLEVLDAHRQAVQGTQRIATRRRLVGRERVLACLVVIARDHRVHGRVDRIHATNAAVEQFASGKLLGADEDARGNGAEVAGFGQGRSLRCAQPHASAHAAWGNPRRLGEGAEMSMTRRRMRPLPPARVRDHSADPSKGAWGNTGGRAVRCRTATST